MNAGRVPSGRKGLSAALAALSLTAICAFAAPAMADLPDGRQWELVSNTGGPTADVIMLPFGRPAADGNAMAFQVLGKMETGPSVFQNTYVATRGADSWSAKLVSPPAKVPPSPICRTSSDPGGVTGLGCPVTDNPFAAFTPDLGTAIFGNKSPFNVALVPGEPLNKYNVYVQDIPSGANTLLTDEDSAGATRGVGEIGGISDDGTKASFQGANGPNFWTAEGGTVALDQTPSASGYKIGSGPNARTTDETWQGADEYYGGAYHAMSSDGSRLYVTFRGGAPSQYPSGVLKVYKDPGTPGAVAQPLMNGVTEASGYFRDSSSDGHKALFTSCNRLGFANSTANGNNQLGVKDCRVDAYNAGTHQVCTTDPGDDPVDPADDVTTCNPEPLPYAYNDLYLWDEDANGGTGGITDLTTQDQANGARVLGVLGASRDLDRVYFVAAGDLDGAGPATFGEPNIYLVDMTTGTPVITYVTAAYRDPTPNGGIKDDLQLWKYAAGDIKHDARVSEDGSTLAFVSRARIDPDYDYGDPNRDPNRDVYVWQIGDTAPACVSCQGEGPSGQDSTLGTDRNSIDDSSGESVTGKIGYPDWYPSNVTADGSKVFFMRLGQLYEYDTATGDSDPLSGGGVSVQFLGATTSGSDVFFRTTTPLLPHHDLDRGGQFDVYDARVGGGQPVPPEGQESCQGSECEQGGTGPGPLEPIKDDSGTAPPKKRFTGARARALRKCKRVKVKKAKRRCVKAARKKPL